MLVTLSLVALLIASICWIGGDILIVGFEKSDAQKETDFNEFMGSENYAFHLPGSERRLRYGALIADYSMPLLLAGLYAHWVLLRESTLGVIGLTLLGIGISLAPLAHGAFYYLGITSKHAYRTWAAGLDAHDAKKLQNTQ